MALYIDHASSRARAAIMAHPGTGGAYIGNVAVQACALVRDDGMSIRDAIDTAFGLVECPFPALAQDGPSPLERALVTTAVGDAR